MNEFAYGLDGRNSHTGNCPHPLDRERISGGSSSGSAWAVAAGVVPLALGTDTGGSIRVPAALCGIYGFRMAWDATRLTGVFPLSRRMDTVGWFVADPGDAVELLRLETGLSGSGDAAASSRTEREAEPALRVGALIPPSVILDDPVAEVWSRTLRTLATGGTDRCVMKDLPSPDVFGTETWKAYNVIGSVDAWDVHAEWLDTYRDLYDPVVWALIDRGRHWSPERLAEAERHREEVARAFGRLFEEVDVLVMPVTPVASPREHEADGDFRERTLRLNVPVSLAGLPALSVPLRHNAVESSGMQVVTPAGKESRLLRFLEVWREVATGEER
jgi:Asp-tRNA(Asn)/Glu-tRNA(Gln) amidotransferase A subunit family amidase